MADERKPASNYFSYVDTALRTIYFNIESWYDDESVRQLRRYIKLFEFAPKFKNNLLKSIIDFNFKKNTRLSYLYFHEWHHYLQSLAYPFAYYLSWIELSTIVRAANAIKAYSDDFDLSGGKFIEIDHKAYHNLTYQVYNFEFIKNNDLLNVTEEVNPAPDANVFCITDLIENSTSIFHYKIIHGIEATASGYWQWLRDPRNKSYKNLFFFLSEKIGYEETYELLPLLTLLSFYVTEPMHAFCNLFNRRFMLKGDVGTNLIIGKRIVASLYEEVDFEGKNYFNIEDTPVGLISYEQYDFILKKTKDFPLSIPAKRFQDDRFNLEKAILEPQLEASTNVLITGFPPLAIHYNFSDFDTRETGMVYNMGEQEADEVHSALLLAELAKIKDVTLSMISWFNKALPKACHHVNCPYFDFGLCHRWNAIPKDYIHCSFPAWFVVNFSKEIIPERGLLQHLKEHEIEDFKKKLEELDKLYLMSHRWEYTFDEENLTYNLVIFKETVENSDISYAVSFVEMLTSRDGLEKIANKIFFIFDGYENAGRAVVEIEEVAQWFRLLKAQLPELFFYLNLNPDTGGNGFMAYFFIEHQLRWRPDKQYELDASQEELKRFLSDEIIVFLEFCRRNNLDPVKHYTNTYSIFL